MEGVENEDLLNVLCADTLCQFPHGVYFSVSLAVIG